METDAYIIQFPLGSHVETITGLKATVVEHDIIERGQLAGVLWSITIQVESADQVIHRMVYNRQLLQMKVLKPYIEKAPRGSSRFYKRIRERNANEDKG